MPLTNQPGLVGDANVSAMGRRGPRMGKGLKNSMTVTSPAVETKYEGGKTGPFGLWKKGGIVPGKGNRDTVKAKLTPGEVVVPQDKAKKALKAMKPFYKPLKPKKGPTGLLEG